MNNKYFKRSVIFVLSLIALWFVACVILLVVSPKLVFRNDMSKNKVLVNNMRQFFEKNRSDEKIEILWSSIDTSKITYLYLSGNVGRLSKVVSDLQKFGNVCSPSYPGYAKSEGEPNTENIYETVDVALKFLKGKNIALKNVIVIGHSLGGSPAMYAAVNYPGLKKVILVNTFYSIKCMCEEQYKVICILGGGILNTSELAPLAKAPLLICHNPNDELIPYGQSKMLFAKVGSMDKSFKDISGTHAGINIAEILAQ